MVNRSSTILILVMVNRSSNIRTSLVCSCVLNKHVSASVNHFDVLYVCALICFPRMNKRLVGLEQHEDE